MKKNVNSIIPKVISEIHDSYFLNLFENGSETSIAKIIHNFALRKDKFMIPIFSLVKSLPRLHENGISFISLLLFDTNLI